MEGITTLEFVDIYKYSMDISKSGKYMVRASNSKIWLTDFTNKKVINKVNATCHSVVDISDDDKFCLFTSEGEARIVVFSLPELVKVASLDVHYASSLKFISLEEILIYQIEKGGAENYSLTKWNFVTNERETLLFEKNSDYPCHVAFSTNESLCMVCPSYKHRRTKLYVFENENLSQFEVEWDDGVLYCGAFSQVLNSHILINRRLKNFDDIGIYNFEDKTYLPLLNYRAMNLYWITDRLIWCSDIYSSSLLNLKGEVLFEWDSGIRLAQCSNEDYVIFSNSCGSYLFKKIKTDNAELQ